MGGEIYVYNSLIYKKKKTIFCKKTCEIRFFCVTLQLQKNQLQIKTKKL